jgi:putative DNA primase/helicase
MSKRPPDYESWTPAQKHEWNAIDYRASKAAAWGGASVAPAANGNGHAAPAAAPIEQTSVETQCIADITPEQILWLWPSWLARGKFHILAGAPGIGKSTIALKIAAAISSGGRWPDGSKAERGTVFIWSGEDGLADTIRPRLEASGADLNRVHVVTCARDGKGKRAFDPSRDVPGLCSTIKTLGGASLIIIDPVVSAVAGDSHKNTETRRGLQPLADLAAELGAALLGITHFSKSTEGRSPLDRVSGSLAFGALARIVMVGAKKQDEEGKPGVRVLMLGKSNIGIDHGGFEYELQNTPLFSNPEIIASTVAWGNKVEGTARDILAEAEAVADKGETSTLDEVKDFLLKFLMDGPRLAKEIKKAAADSEYCWRTVNTAKAGLGIVSLRDGFQGPVKWAIPPKDAKDAKNLCQENSASYGNFASYEGESGAISDTDSGAIDSSSDAADEGLEGEI